MTDTIRSGEELAELLEEQILFLKSSCESFDAGFEGEIKRLAVSVRVLVHDTGKSTSLMNLNNCKTIGFFDTALPYDDNNLISHSSLVEIRMDASGTKSRAILDTFKTSRTIDFDTW